jgi:hypothetical protein
VFLSWFWPKEAKRKLPAASKLAACSEAAVNPVAIDVLEALFVLTGDDLNDKKGEFTERVCIPRKMASNIVCKLRI